MRVRQGLRDLKPSRAYKGSGRLIFDRKIGDRNMSSRKGMGLGIYFVMFLSLMFLSL